MSQILGIQGWRRQAEDRRMVASSEWGLGPEGTVIPWMDGEENTQVACLYRHVFVLACDFCIWYSYVMQNHQII